MLVNDYNDLNETHKDLLMELGNIGTGNALTSLSQMINHPIKMELPSIHIVDYSRIAEQMEQKSERNAGVVIEVRGSLECVVTFLLNEHFTGMIAEELTGEPMESLETMNDMQHSAICEIGNIMCNSYLNALASMLEADLSVGLPNLRIGSLEQVMCSFSRNYLRTGREVLFVENKFSYMEQEFISHILLLPTIESLQMIIEKLSY